MGVDAGIFAKKAKKYFWFDRLSNIQKYWNAPNEFVSDLSDTYDHLMMESNNLSESEILNFLNASVQAWEAGEEEQQYHAGWVRKIIKFVKAHSGDNFFVAADNDNAYDLIGEMHGKSGGIWRGEYMEWTK